MDVTPEEDRQIGVVTIVTVVLALIGVGTLIYWLFLLALNLWS